jgi:hypothetical protein
LSMKEKNYWLRLPDLLMDTKQNNKDDNIQCSGYNSWNTA